MAYHEKMVSLPRLSTLSNRWFGTPTVSNTTAHNQQPTPLLVLNIKKDFGIHSLWLIFLQFYDRWLLKCSSYTLCKSYSYGGLLSEDTLPPGTFCNKHAAFLGQGNGKVRQNQRSHLSGQATGLLMFGRSDHFQFILVLSCHTSTCQTDTTWTQRHVTDRRCKYHHVFGSSRNS